MIVAIGDVHGKFSQLKIGIRNILNETVSDETPINFVQVGDFGVGFDSPLETYNELLDLQRDLLSANSHLWIIRGNHDNPAFWGENGYLFSNIHFVKDNTLMSLDDKLCFFAGGAISIDRSKRISGVSYWKGEEYVFDASVINNITNSVPSYSIDLVFTHDIYLPLTNLKFLSSDVVKNWENRDPFLSHDLTAQQYQFKLLYESLLTVTSGFKWYHGHYHESYTQYDDKIMTCCLNELEFKEIF